jgi:DNA-binding PadR family transcriptional regulator
MVSEPQPVMVPYVLDTGWKADSQAARVTVLTQLIEAEDAGDPMRVRAHGDIKGAADRIAQTEEGADAKAVEKTLAVLAAEGHAETGKATTAQRKAANVWRVTAKGREWLAAQTAGAGGFVSVEDDAGQCGAPWDTLRSRAHKHRRRKAGESQRAPAGVARPYPSASRR